jgi:hypothetical protein
MSFSGPERQGVGFEGTWEDISVEPPKGCPLKPPLLRTVHVEGRCTVHEEEAQGLGGLACPAEEGNFRVSLEGQERRGGWFSAGVPFPRSSPLRDEIRDPKWHPLVSVFSFPYSGRGNYPRGDGSTSLHEDEAGPLA